MSNRGKIFKEAPIIAPKRSWHDCSYDNTFDFNIGQIVPSLVMANLPGDDLEVQSSGLARFQALLSPVMDRVNQFNYNFFVRNRDIWYNWDKFITNNDQKKTWQQQSSFVPPVMPFFKVKDVLYNKILNTPVGITFDGTGNKNVHFNNVSTCYSLYLFIHRATGETTYFVIDNSSFSVHSLNLQTLNLAGYYTIVVNFLPNVSDFDYRIKPFTSPSLRQGYRNYKLNPFSNNELMDFLGVDIKGVYSAQWQCLQTTMSNAIFGSLYGLNAFSYFSHALGEMTSLEYLNPNDFGTFFVGSINSIDAVPEFSFDRDTFFVSHVIESVFFMQDDNSTPDGSKMTFFHMSVNDTGFRVDYRDLSLGSTDSAWHNSRTGSVSPFVNKPEKALSILPVRAYNFIYDEYFRDQNYISVNPITDYTRDGNEFAGVSGIDDISDMVSYLTLKRKAYEHDAYTSALPGPQRGDAVRFLSDAKIKVSPTASTVSGETHLMIGADTSGVASLVEMSSGTYYKSSVSVDLSAATIENFRWANAMQKYLEKKARTGGRYYEWIIGIWNKEVSDAKLNRPIYLDGKRTPIQISEVVQTSSTNTETGQPLGDLAGRAISIDNTGHLNYNTPDYGFFFELTAVVPRTSYMNGLNPYFAVESYLDFPLPDFAQLGEEYVHNYELYFSADDSVDNGAFGYQSRYYNHKYRRSECHGSFKDSLDFWTFARKFDSLPVNGQWFIECHPDYRQFAVVSPNVSHIQMTRWHDIQANRPLPEFSVPIL